MIKSKTFYKSKSNQNLINYSRKNDLSQKYSNTVLFQKREELLLLKQKHSKKYKKRKAKVFNIMTSDNNSNYFQKNIFSKNPFFTFNSIPFYTPTNTTKNFHLNKSPSYTVNKRKIPKLYLTEEALLHNNIIRKSEIKNPTQKDALTTDLEKIYDENKSKNNLNFLFTIQKDLKEYRERNKDNNEINEKIKKLNKKENSRRGLVKKINTFKYLEFMAFLKKEREENKKEEQENEYAFIQDKLSSLDNAMKLFSVKFLNRISDYIRHLDNIKNSIKTENINLIKEKMKIKREIFHLNTEINKIKEKKEGILRWVYLQIKVKEKKLILPKYYKTIIEANRAQILQMQSKFDENFQQLNLSIKRERDDKLRAQKLKKSYMKKKSTKKDQGFSSPTKKNKNIFSSKSEKTVFSLSKKTFFLDYSSPKKNEENIAMNKVKIFIGNESSRGKKDKEGAFLTKDEFDKIVFWKFRPIYQTADEFIESLNYLDLKNIHLLEYYNQLQFRNYCFRQELFKIRSSKDKYDSNIDEQLSQKSSELEKVRNKHIMILKTHEKINENKIINKKIKDKSKINRSFSDSEINKIYHKLNDMFDNCKIVNNKELTELIYYYIKSERTKEGEMIYLIEYIECTLDFLIEKISQYKMDDDLKEKVHDIAVQIDKEHKLEKPNKQKLEDKKKHLNLIQKVMKKSEQHFIMPTRHIDLVHYNVRELGKPKKRKKLNKDDFPNLEDFMKNPHIINDIYYNIDSKESS